VILFAAGSAGYHWALDLQIWSGVIFVLLLFVLGAFVAPGVGAAMRKREESIVERVHAAQSALAEIDRIRERQKVERRRMLQEAAELRKEAQADADRLRGEMIARAQEEVERTKHRVDREIRLATQKAMHELWSTSAELSVQVARRILQQRLGADDQKRLIDEAVQEIGKVAEAKS
jgi:F-type H+-transporting ATPase subunit b